MKAMALEIRKTKIVQRSVSFDTSLLKGYKIGCVSPYPNIGGGGEKFPWVHMHPFITQDTPCADTRCILDEANPLPFQSKYYNRFGTGQCLHW